MKKLIVALLVICMVAAAIGIGTWALFSDYETSPDNTFCAGDLDLKVDGLDDPTVATYFEIACMKPGDEGVVEIVLSNVGCVDGVADIHIKEMIDHENGIIEPEGEGNKYPDGNPLVPGDLPCEGDSGLPDLTPNVGELSQYLEFVITADMDAVPVGDPLDGDYETVVVPLGNLTDIECINWIYGDLPAESDIGLKIEWFLPETVCNIIMTDCVTFDIEFSLNQKVGEVVGNVTEIVQNPTGIEGFAYDFDVVVHNAGDIAGNFWVNVEIQDSGGVAVFTASEYVTGLAPCDTTTLSFSWTAGAAGIYTVIADGVECPFEVFAPPNVMVTGIQQDASYQICEDISVGIDIHNDGDVPSEPTQVFAMVTTAVGDPLSALAVIPIPAIDPCETIKVPWDIGHADESWRGTILINSGMDMLDYATVFTCPVQILQPATFDITSIQQPTAVQSCEDIVIGVDVHNSGDKPGACQVDIDVQVDGVSLAGFPTNVDTGVLDPCDTVKIPLPPIHALPEWEGNSVDVIADACGDVETCSINIMGEAYIVVTGIQQEPEMTVCEEYVVGVDIHNAGGKPGECELNVYVLNAVNPMVPLRALGPFPTGMLLPCETTKIPVNIGHIDEEWLSLPQGLIIASFACAQDVYAAFPCPVVVIPPPPPPIPPESTNLQYLVDMEVAPEFGAGEIDHPFDVHILRDVYPADTECSPCEAPDPLCADADPGTHPPPPQVLSYQMDIDVNADPVIFFPPQRPMALFGFNMNMQLWDADIWQSEADTTMVFEHYKTYPPVPGTSADWDYATVNYSGTQPGWPYDPVPSETWQAFWMFGGKVIFSGVFEGCVPPMPFKVTCHVEGVESVTVPYGTFDAVHIHCDYLFVQADDDGDSLVDEDGGDGIDNDLDTLIDEDDTDGFDNDGDTLVDEDPGNDGVDNDLDTLVDEDRWDVDNDGDGLWNEDHEDTVDNDLDTLVDEDTPPAGPPPPDGSRDMWWVESGIGSGFWIKLVNDNAPWVGTETWELNTVS